MRERIIIAVIMCLAACAGVHGQATGGNVYVAQPAQPATQDTLATLPLFETQEETLLVTPDSVATDTTGGKDAFRPDPEKVIWLGAIIPGFGQIANKKYWQLPIVYGAYMGCAFAVTWFSSEYKFYKTAYRDIIDTDPTTNSHMEYLEGRGLTIDQMGGLSSYRDKLKNYQDNYRRYRDLSILFSVGVYGLSILWAYVDAQLYDFDISPDLSMRFQPAIINNDVVYASDPNAYDAFSQPRVIGNTHAVGIQWNIRIK